MPAAPLAKGLILSLTVLVAASLAIYENPQVRKWVDSSRRKIAIALHSLGDEITPPSPSTPDASTREDESPDAVERRRKARQEILERGRVMEERRRSKRGGTCRATTFDDFVDKNGSLRKEAGEATTTAAETQAGEASLRNRNAEISGATLGAAVANPFGDEMHSDFSLADQQLDQTTPPSRESTATVEAPPSPQAATPNLRISTSDQASNHPSEQLLDLTPTTSASSTSHLADLPSNYWSVPEWTESTLSPFYSPPHSESAGEAAGLDAQVGATDNASQAGSESDLDLVSEIGEGTSTPGSWTEVGSVVSEDH